jgi:hypothetical protein
LRYKLCFLSLCLSSILSAQALPENLKGPINLYAKKYNIPVFVMERLIIGEDMLHHPTASNPDGTKDHGIMAFNDTTIIDIRKVDPKFDPYDTIQALDWGGRKLQERYKFFGNWYDTIGSWNMGVRGWKDYLKGKRGLPTSTRRLLTIVFGKT